MPAVVTLRVTEGPLRGAEFSFAERGTCVLGRAPDCSPRLPDDPDHRTISRHHCLLDVNPPDIRIRDFGSRNGTYINGVKIGQREAHQTPQEAAALAYPEHDLAEGDEVRLGTTVLQVQVITPPTCVDCGRELAGEPTTAYPAGPPSRCAPCQVGAGPQRAAPRVPDRCAGCGRAAVPDGARRGELLCQDCRSDPRQLVRRLLALAEAGHPELAPLQGLTVRRELGRGGTAAVYLAHREPAEELVALKVLLPRVPLNADGQQRFLYQVEQAAALRHRHLVPVHHVGAGSGAFYLLTEYCPGGSAERQALGAGGTLPLEQALALVLPALEGLAHAHGRGVVHRDLNPRQLLLGGTDADPVPKLCDVGLTRAFDQAGLGGLSRTGAGAGSPHYLPRQQVLNVTTAEPEVDTWAAAACLYRLLTGHAPRDFPPGQDPWRVVLQERPVPIRQRNPAVPKAVAEVVDEALRDQPVIGFRTAAALQAALRRAIAEP